MTDLLTIEKPHYECFCDVAYYDLWAVREAGERRWGHCFHVQTKDEAEGLVKLLNDAMQREERLRKAATEYMRVMEDFYDMELAEPEVTAVLREALSNEVPDVGSL